MYATARSLFVLIVTYLQTASPVPSRSLATLHGQARSNKTRITQIVPISPTISERHNKRMRISLEISRVPQEEPRNDNIPAVTSLHNQTYGKPKEAHQTFVPSLTDHSDSTNTENSQPDTPHLLPSPPSSGSTATHTDPQHAKPRRRQGPTLSNVQKKNRKKPSPWNRSCGYSCLCHLN